MKRLVGLLCIFALLGILVSAMAETPEPVICTLEGVVESGTVDVGISNDAAIEGFINRAFHIPTKKRSQTRNVILDGLNGRVYTAIESVIKEIAAGERESTSFSVFIGNDVNSLAYTKEQLQVSSFVDAQGYIADGVMEAYFELAGVNIKTVIDSLLVNLPYDLYWFDKTVGYSYSIYFTGDNKLTIFNEGSLIITMYVSSDYSLSGNQGTTEYNTAIGTTISDAAENAQNIVTANRSKSDYQKLLAYKTSICDLVSYNGSAAAGNTPYGNPWQLIWVFDNNPNTNVVCEGYSKAFKYLCDESTFDTEISCITVTGYLSGADATGAGRHMWNVVKMDNNNRYLVDVTNCDSGFSLFLVGYSDTLVQNDKTWYIYDGQLAYLYDDDLTDLYSAEELEVASEDYPAPSIVASLATPVIRNVSHGTTIGTDVSAEFECSEDTARGEIYLGYIDDNGDYQQITSMLDCDFDSTTHHGSVEVGGYKIQRPGTYQLRAKAFTWVWGEPPSDTVGDSDFAIYEFTLENTELPTITVNMSISECNYGEYDDVTYSITGVDNVAVVLTAYSMYNDGTSGSGLYDGYAASDSLYYEVGRNVYTFYGHFNGLWSKPCIREVIVHPLGVLDAPTITYQGQTVGNTLTAMPGTSLTFNALCVGALSINGTVEVKTPQGYYDWVTEIEIDGESGSFDLDGSVLDPGEYKITVYGTKGWDSGWDYYVKTIVLTVADAEGIIATGTCGDNLSWVLSEDGVLTISGTGAMANFASDEEHLAPWYDYYDDIQTVVIESGVTSVGDMAFYSEYSSLSAVSLPGTVTSIGDRAFLGCSALTSISLPASLTSIGEKAFMSSGLTSITLPANLQSIGITAFANCNLASVIAEGNQITTRHFFYDTDNGELLYHIAFPSSVTTIGAGAFYGNPLPYDTPDFVTPSALTTIESEAFYGIAARYVWLSDSVQSIGASAFAGCSSLKYVYVPNDCGSIGTGAFPVNTVIIGYYGTVAEDFANQPGYTFVGLQNPFGGDG